MHLRTGRGGLFAGTCEQAVGLFAGVGPVGVHPYWLGPDYPTSPPHPELAVEGGGGLGLWHDMVSLYECLVNTHQTRGHEIESLPNDL